MINIVNKWNTDQHTISQPPKGHYNPIHTNKFNIVQYSTSNLWFSTLFCTGKFTKIHNQCTTVAEQLANGKRNLTNITLFSKAKTLIEQEWIVTIYIAYTSSTINMPWHFLSTFQELIGQILGNKVNCPDILQSR